MRPARSNRFNQLRWKLTLSYTAVTVGVLVTLELILLGAFGIWSIFLVNSGALPQQLIKIAATQATPALRIYLSQTPPDQESIVEFLAWVDTVTSQTIPLSIDATDAMLVVGSDGTLLGVEPPDLLGQDMIGQPLDPQAVPGLEEPLQAALAGSEDIEQLYMLDEQGEHIVIAIPVWDTDHQQVLGVAIGIAEAPTVWSVLGDLVPILGVSLLIFTTIAGLTGIPFGYVAARGLVRRFARLAEASLAWSQGDFSVLINDPSGDELGQLALRLNSMADQLQTLFQTRRQLAIAEERNRLARDLHDSAKQQAFATAAQIAAARSLLKTDPVSAEQRILEAEQLAYDLRQELTLLIQELYPAALEERGLTATLHDHIADWSRQHDITANIQIAEERALPIEVGQALFRMVQEALSNVARHSKADRVEIELAYSDDQITLTVSDDGRGFDMNSKPRGFGLRSIQERASSLGGHLAIESRLDTGTMLTCTMPISVAEESYE